MRRSPARLQCSTTRPGPAGQTPAPGRSTFAMPDDQRNRDGISLASTLVAITLLLVLGVTLAIGATRYTENDLAKLIGTLGPLFSIDDGAFVTYFYTRHAVQRDLPAAETLIATHFEHSEA